ncbi:hypothetical protein R80B4_03222 [Fibrobacteres bacterium R8-0-B4]
MTNNAITYRFNGPARKITTPIGVSMWVRILPS